MKQNKGFKSVVVRRFFDLLVIVLISGCYTPPRDDALIHEAWNLCTKRKYDECIASSSEALAINPSNLYAYQARAFCYVGKGMYDKAIADYTQLLRDPPLRAVAYSGRGDCYRHKGEYDQAIADYRRALETKPGFAPAMNGYELALKEQMQEARAQYEQAVASRQKMPQSAGNDLSVRPKGTAREPLAPDINSLRQRLLPSSKGEAFEEVNVIIHGLEVRPTTIRSGEKFDIFVEYTIMDSLIRKDRVSATLGFRILEDGQPVFSSKPSEISCINGKRSSKTTHLRASRKKGTYTVEVTLNYKSMMKDTGKLRPTEKQADYSVKTTKKSRIKRVSRTANIRIE